MNSTYSIRTWLSAPLVIVQDALILLLMSFGLGMLPNSLGWIDRNDDFGTYYTYFLHHTFFFIFVLIAARWGARRDPSDDVAPSSLHELASQEKRTLLSTLKSILAWVVRPQNFAPACAITMLTGVVAVLSGAVHAVFIADGTAAYIGIASIVAVDFGVVAAFAAYRLSRETHDAPRARILWGSGPYVTQLGWLAVVALIAVAILRIAAALK